MNPASMIDEYLAGPTLLRQALAGMTDEQLNAVPVPGKWSSRQVLCHIADFELVYADRMKRVIAEDAPTFFGGDPDTFAAGLAYQTRDAQEELQLIESIRRHMTRILRSLDTQDFLRTGNHRESGPLALVQLLEGITSHLPHHVAFILEKRKLLPAAAR